MPDDTYLAVVDPNGVMIKVRLLSGDNGRNLVHPGGMQVMGEVLAVALADGPNCAPLPPPPVPDDDVVRFYDISSFVTTAPAPTGGRGQLGCRGGSG